MNFPDFAAIFEVAAPYVPSDTSSGSDDSGLSTRIIAIIVFVIIAVVALLIFLGACYYGRRRRQGSPPPRTSSYAIDLPPARAAPVTIVSPQRNPVFATYASPPSSARYE
jgi:heme/copper-type cytochrome/quinol oxidase subunit 2